MTTTYVGELRTHIVPPNCKHDSSQVLEAHWIFGDDHTCVHDFWQPRVPGLYFLFIGVFDLQPIPGHVENLPTDREWQAPMNMEYQFCLINLLRTLRNVTSS